MSDLASFNLGDRVFDLFCFADNKEMGEGIMLLTESESIPFMTLEV